jgi:uncharacterized protein (UPF0276 family)
MDGPRAAPNVGIGWRQPHYAQVITSRPALDFLEVHSENFFAAGGASMGALEQACALYPISLHGVGLSLGSVVGLDTWHLDQLERLVRRIDPVRVSDHAAFARGQFRSGTVHAGDLLPVPLSSEALTVMAANVGRVQDRLGRVLLVENLSSYLSWHPTPDETMWSEAAFLTQLCHRAGCELLLDVNNLYVNALNAQLQGVGNDPLQSCRDWLDAIPLGTVGEIHLAGHCHVNDVQGEIVIDDHGSRVCAAVWTLYRHAIARFAAVPTLLEWDTDIPELSVLLDEAHHARTVCASVASGVSA